MSSIKLSPKKFNPKRPGALIGTITEASEHLKLLYTIIGKTREKRVPQPSHDYFESHSYSACCACNESGSKYNIDPRRMIAPELSLKRGAVLLWAGTNCRPVSMIKELAYTIGIDYEKPLVEQDQRFINILLYGYDKEPVSYVHKKKQWTGFYQGCVSNLRDIMDSGTTSKGNLRAIEFFSEQRNCTQCLGTKLNPESLAILIQGQSILDVLRLPISDLLQFIQKLPTLLEEHERKMTSQVIEEIEVRLIHLNKIGLRTLLRNID